VRRTTTTSRRVCTASHQASHGNLYAGLQLEMLAAFVVLTATLLQLIAGSIAVGLENGCPFIGRSFSTGAQGLLLIHTHHGAIHHVWKKN
jgi:hypothetical protein